jgi:hypothetical protein
VGEGGRWGDRVEKGWEKKREEKKTGEGKGRRKGFEEKGFRRNVKSVINPYSNISIFLSLSLSAAVYLHLPARPGWTPL